MNQSKQVIGRSVWVSLPTIGAEKVPAKIDTGADASSIWCSKKELVDGHLHCVFFGPESKYYDGKTWVFNQGDFEVTQIASSFGHKEIRYKVKIPVVIEGKRVKATFTLADRSKKLFPVLIGLAAIRGKFLVDPSVSGPLKKEERRKKKALAELMKQLMKEMGL